MCHGSPFCWTIGGILKMNGAVADGTLRVVDWNAMEAKTLIVLVFSMVRLSLSLVGGPPWGFRVKQNEGEAPTVSQVIFDSRAYKEGVRTNDIIENIDDEECSTVDQVHAKMRNAQEVLRLRLRRYDSETDSGAQVSELSDASDKTPTVEHRQLPLDEIAPNFSKPPLPIYSQTLDENSSNFGYYGGSRGSAQDKKKYFEQLAMKQLPWPQPQTDRILERKILLGSKQPPLPSDQSSLSGYDSVGADYAGFRTTDSSDRQTPVSSIDPMEDWYSPHASGTNYDIRSPFWLPTLPEEISQASERDNYDATSTPLSLNNGEMVQAPKVKPIPPPTPPKPIPSESTWRIRSTDRHGSIITSPTNGIEVPRPQSVAQLREQITSKLEMKTPAGSRPMSPAVIHPPVQPQRVSITPQPFGRSSTRDSESRMSVSIYSDTPFSVTSSNTSAATSPLVDNYRYHYDEFDLPSKYGTLPSNFSLGTNTLDTGFSSAPSTLKRQHSLVFSSPEVQHAMLLNPENGASNGDLAYSNSYYPSSVNASNDTLKEMNTLNESSNDFILSETGAPFSVKPPPIPVDGSIFMLGGETVSDSYLSDARDIDSPTLTLDYPLNSTTNKLNQPHMPAKSQTMPPTAKVSPPEFATVSSPAMTLAELSGILRPPDEQQQQSQSTSDSPHLTNLTSRPASAYESADISVNSLLSVPTSTYHPLASPSSLGDSATHLTNGVSHGFDEMPSRQRYDSENLDGQTWYKRMYKQLHHIDEQQDKTVLKYQLQDFSPSPMTSTTSHHPIGFIDESNSLPNTDSLQRRSKSVGNHVEPKSPADKWRESERNAAQIGALQNGSALLSKGINELKKLSMDEMLQRQRAERLSEELEEQNNRRHHYVPNAAPALQNNFSRFDHLLNNDFEHRSSRSSTPKRAATAPPIQTATVLYKFVAQTSRELSLNRGDVVRVNRELDSNWYEGERNGQVGIFPTSYVQLDEDPSTSRQNRVRAMYPFQARNRNELSLRKGEILKKRRAIDAHWYEGTNSKGQIGIFPESYVQDYYEGCEDEAGSVVPDRPKTPKISTLRVESPAPTKKIDRTPQVQAWEQRHSSLGLKGPAHIVPKNAETYRAIYAYKPQHSDELELIENDIVFVVEKCDDGWFIGTLLRNGQFGTFPGNYVEKH
uniref:Sorbin and SH3 domain-containing protein 1 n=1 Tax=Acrobeloides nanus TaxID=290746 RepID=A0A914DFX7_9BILA